MNKYKAILTKLRMPLWQRIDMMLRHLFGGFSSGFYAIDWWSYQKFVADFEPEDWTYTDDPAWTPEERARLLIRGSASLPSSDETAEVK